MAVEQLPEEIEWPEDEKGRIVAPPDFSRDFTYGEVGLPSLENLRTMLKKKRTKSLLSELNELDILYTGAKSRIRRDAIDARSQVYQQVLEERVERSNGPVEEEKDLLVLRYGPNGWIIEPMGEKREKKGNERARIA